MKKIKDKIKAETKEDSGKVVVKHSFSFGMGILTFIFALTLIFVIAKIWGPIDWSWWWVFAPLWIPIGAVCSICLVLVLILLVVVLMIVFIIGILTVKEEMF